MADRRQLDFHGTRDDSFDATWGQRTTWDDVQFFRAQPQWWFVIKRIVDVPAGLSLDQVLSALAHLVAAHEATRTHFAQHGERLVQTVVARGALEVEVIEACGDRLEPELDTLKNASFSRPFDHGADLPLRLAVGLRDGVPAAVLMALSHVTVDVQSANVLAAELAAAFGALADGMPTPPLRPAWQPLDLARAEQGEKGRRWNTAALEHLGGQLSRIPPTMFGRAREDPAPPRYRAATLTSPTVGPALQQIAARCRLGGSAVLLGVTAALIRELTGTSTVTFGLLSANRVDPMLRHAVGNLSQAATATVEVADGPFAQLATAAGNAALGAHRNAHYDPQARAALVAETESARGVRFDLGCRFNDMFSSRAGAAAPALRRAESVLTWHEGLDEDKLTFFVEFFNEQGTAGVKVLADCARIAPEEIPAFLFGLESALVRLADGELTAAEVGRCARRAHP